MKSEEIKKEIAELTAKRDELNNQIRAKNFALLDALTSELPYRKGEKLNLFKYEKFIGEGIF